MTRLSAVKAALFARLRIFAHWWPVALIFAGGGALYVLGAQHVLSVEALRDRQAALAQAVALHPVLAALAFVAMTAAYLLLSLPAEGLLTATSGMLFGAVAGTALSVVGTVIAAMLLLLALRRVLRRQPATPQYPTIERIRRRLERDGVYYLLMLRLLPVLPFALVSLLAVLARVRTWPYLLATAAGSIPPTVVFASAGSGLGALLAKPGPVNLADLLSDRVLLPLVGLAVLAVLPVARRCWPNYAARKQIAAGRS